MCIDGVSKSFKQHSVPSMLYMVKMMIAVSFCTKVLSDLMTPPSFFNKMFLKISTFKFCKFCFICQGMLTGRKKSTFSETIIKSLFDGNVELPQYICLYIWSLYWKISTKHNLCKKNRWRKLQIHRDSMLVHL